MNCRPVLSHVRSPWFVLNTRREGVSVSPILRCSCSHMKPTGLRSGGVSWRFHRPSVRIMGCMETTPSPQHPMGVGDDADFPSGRTSAFRCFLTGLFISILLTLFNDLAQPDHWPVLPDSHLSLCCCSCNRLWITLVCYTLSSSDDDPCWPLSLW